MTKMDTQRPADRTNRTAYSYVRFSTPEQLKGDSLRRQLELSREYALAHDLRLDETLSLRDLGVSAFRGKNRTCGALASFLEAVGDGRVSRGSCLLIESLDRLSRDQITEALPTFLQIVNAGITVVTLADDMSYSKESLDANMGNLMMSLIIMSRAHEESAMKSKRLTAAWRGKRLSISDRKLTTLAPAWLSLNSDRNAFDLIPERVEIVRRIFQLSEQGLGKRAIALRFNSEGIETWGRGKRRGNGWHDSYIQKILHNRAVLGEYQPHRMQNGRRVPEGEAIPDYFPAVIDRATFLRVRARRVNAPGPVGNQVSNLFTGLAVDGYTDAAMRFVDKGTASRGNGRWKYLKSDYQRLHPDARSCYWRYDKFEQLFLRFIRELNWQSILDEGKNTEAHTEEDEVGALEDRDRVLQRAAARILDAIETSPEAPAVLVERLHSLETEKEVVKSELTQKRGALERRRRAESEISREENDFKALVVNASDFETRFRLREEIRRKIARIEMFPHGLQREWRNAEYHVSIDSAEPVFSIQFHNGVRRWVVTLGDRPEALTIQQVGEGEEMSWHLNPSPDGTRTWTDGQPVPAEVLNAFSLPLN
jgi:DNA invertase Pin-like site-specific DNA recombinase